MCFVYMLCENLVRDLRTGHSETEVDVLQLFACVVLHSHQLSNGVVLKMIHYFMFVPNCNSRYDSTTLANIL